MPREELLRLLRFFLVLFFRLVPSRSLAQDLDGRFIDHRRSNLQIVFQFGRLDRRIARLAAAAAQAADPSGPDRDLPSQLHQDVIGTQQQPDGGGRQGQDIRAGTGEMHFQPGPAGHAQESSGPDGRAGGTDAQQHR